MLKRMFATLGLYSGLATSVLAAEFTWFTDVQGREGWIEFAAETVSFQNRIHVFPRIGAPRIEGRSDGVVVTFEIDSDAPAGAAGFTQSVLSKVVTDPSRVSQNYQVNVPRPRGLRIKILRDGTELAGRQIDGQIPGRYTLQIKVPVSGTERETMLRGEFQVEAAFDLPTANFSSLAVNVKESLVTHYKIEAFKSVVKSARTSGGKFLFFDWRRRSARTIINQSINEQRSTNVSRQTNSTNVSRQTNVLTIDPNEAMIARVEQLLGISSLSKEAFVARHLAAAEKAKTAGDYDLAALHEEYALKADDPTPKVQTELLEKAFTALSGSEPAIAAFLANGIQFSETSGSSSSRFHGFGQTNTSYFGSNLCRDAADHGAGPIRRQRRPLCRHRGEPYQLFRLRHTERTSGHPRPAEGRAEQRRRDGSCRAAPRRGLQRRLRAAGNDALDHGQSALQQRYRARAAASRR
jgi:hypothetical protein